MNLVDSSGWLEYFTDDKNAKYFAPVIENTNELIVSTINIYEVYKKILIMIDENTALEAIALMYHHSFLFFPIENQTLAVAPLCQPLHLLTVD